MTLHHHLLAVAAIISTGGQCNAAHGQTATPVANELPTRGICAHRGASTTHPENTLVALREAVRLGAHMVEFDVALTRDGELVLMHDATLERTTDGNGAVGDFTLAELRKLDAGSWKAGQFRGERIPTLAETLAAMPTNVWLNIHLKGGAELAEKTAQQVVADQRLPQSFLACGSEAAQAARKIEPSIQICNMERQYATADYVNATIQGGDAFIQLWRRPGEAVAPKLEYVARLKRHGIRVNFCCTNNAAELRMMFNAGVEFPLVDDVEAMLQVAEQHGISRNPSRVLEQKRLHSK